MAVSLLLAAMTLAVDVPPVPTLSEVARPVLEAHFDAVQAKVRDEATNSINVPYYRYFWVNADAADYEDFLITFSVHVNLLSRKGKIKPPHIVSKNVLRVDIRDYDWDKNAGVYELLAEQDPIFHADVKVLKPLTHFVYWPGGFDLKEKKFFKRGKFKINADPGDTFTDVAPWLPRVQMDEMRRLLFTEVPIISAEWFFVQTARQVNIRNKEAGTGYYDFLGLKDRQAYFDLIGLDEKKAFKLYQEWRAVVEASGISQQNRQIARLGSTNGGAWGTFDTFVQEGRGEATANLKRGDFAHDAEEWYGFLPNKLMATFLSDKNGVRQATAPDKIGPDKSSFCVGNDTRVHANISCIRCHGTDKEMLKPINDWTRNAFKAGGPFKLADPDRELTLELESQYLRDINRELDRDRRMYSEAIAEATVCKKYPKGLTSAQFTKLYCGLWNKYVESKGNVGTVDLKEASRWLGVPSERIVKSLKAYKDVKGRVETPVATYLMTPPGKLTRLTFENHYRFLATLVHNVLPVDLPKKR